MIPRYSRPEMVALWSPETKFRIWYEIEAHACDAQAALGVIPKANAEAVWRAKDVTFDVARIDEIEAVTKHDVIAFLTSLEEKIGPEARFIHLGCTSSDIVDTANAVLFKQAGVILKKDIETLLATLSDLAHKHKGLLCIGRTHGIHAEPTSFGLKMAGFYAEFQRHAQRVADGLENVRVGKISGAVGTYAFLSTSRPTPWRVWALRSTPIPPR